MTLEEFKKKYESDPEWAPGWDAIDEAFDKIYPGQKPAHFGTDLMARASLGGNSYLDGSPFLTPPRAISISSPMV